MTMGFDFGAMPPELDGAATPEHLPERVPRTEQAIRILMLEDAPTDAEMAERQLRGAGMLFTSMRVDTRDAFVRALGEFKPDIVLADYRLPSFDGYAALKIVRKSHPDIPVVMVTGTLGDVAAVELLKSGARDYVLKDNLVRLPPAVRRALSEERGIRARKRAEQGLARSERYYRKLIEGGSDVFFVVDRDGMLLYRSEAGKRLTGYDTQDVLGKDITTYVAQEDLPLVRRAMAEALQHPDQPIKVELRFLRRDGSLVDMEITGRNFLADPDIGGIVVTARDITERKLADKALARVNRALKTLSGCNTAMVHATDEADLLNEMCSIIVELGGYHLAWVGYLVDDGRKTIVPKSHYGLNHSYLERAAPTWSDTELGRGPAGSAIRTARPQVVRDAISDPDYLPWRENAVQLGYRSVAGFPLTYAGTMYGALCIYSVECDGFDQEELGLLGELAGDLAFGIATLRTRSAQTQSAERLRRSMEGTIQAMAATLEMRDAYTAGHQRRVAELAVAIAGELRLPEDRIHGLHLAAVVHDLGKIQIPAEILSNPSRLTEMEQALIRVHPEAGYNILKEVDFPWPIAQIVYQHHERLDGSGYPRGLKGEDILFEARILAVADTVEAMSSHRPYRPGFGIDKALDEIGKGRGGIYDRDVVDACQMVFRENKFAFAL